MFVHDWATRDSTEASNSCSPFLVLTAVCFPDNVTDVHAAAHLTVFTRSLNRQTSHTSNTISLLSLSNTQTGTRSCYLPPARWPECRWCCPELSHSQKYSRHLWNNSVVRTKRERQKERRRRREGRGNREVGKVMRMTRWDFRQTRMFERDWRGKWAGRRDGARWK